MDIESLDRLHRVGERGSRRNSGRGHARKLLTPVYGRAMTMEYVFFIAVLAAVGLITSIIWRIFVSGTLLNSFGSGAPRHPLHDAPIPPFKRTISGTPKPERDQVRFQEKLDAWQRAHDSRLSRVERPSIPVNGMKYEFVPRKREGNVAAGR